MAQGLLRSAPGVPEDGRIVVVRGRRVILDTDLAALYGITTSQLNQQVKRNADRFPMDFAFRLSRDELREVVANCDHLRNLKFSSRLPMAFTEFGALMAANVVNSEEAVTMSVLVVRAFVRLRDRLAQDREIAEKVAELERRVIDHDETLRSLVETLRELLDPPAPADDERPRIGFRAEDGHATQE
jgi:hypothetical protein